MSTQLQFDGIPLPPVVPVSADPTLAAAEAVLAHIAQIDAKAEADYEEASNALWYLDQEYDEAKARLAEIQVRREPLMRAKHDAHKVFAQTRKAKNDAWSRKVEIKQELGMLK